MKKHITIFFLAITVYVHAQEFGTNDLRISDIGPNDATSYFAFDPRIAYSETNDNYLVVRNASASRHNSYVLYLNTVGDINRFFNFKKPYGEQGTVKRKLIIFFLISN